MRYGDKRPAGFGSHGKFAVEVGLLDPADPIFLVFSQRYRSWAVPSWRVHELSDPLRFEFNKIVSTTACCITAICNKTLRF